MGKIKKDKKLKMNYKTDEQKEMTRLIIIIVIVAILVGGAYLLTRAFVTKDLFTSDTTEEGTVTAGEINYDVAIVGNILNRPYKQYYVVVYDSTNTDVYYDMYSMVSSYTAEDSHLHVYTVDLSNELNKAYYDAENVNLDSDNVSDLRFGDATLLKIKNGKIVKAITDTSKMEKELGL